MGGDYINTLAQATAGKPTPFPLAAFGRTIGNQQIGKVVLTLKRLFCQWRLRKCRLERSKPS